MGRAAAIPLRRRPKGRILAPMSRVFRPFSATSPHRARAAGGAGAVLALTLALGLAVIAWSAPVQAQAPGDDPPYEADLMRLSEILGALHYLRPLCGGEDGTLWRDQMRALLDAEVRDEARERRFIERFNQGYRGFSSVYRRCTPAAEAALARYVEEGGALIRDVTTRYNR